MTVTAEIQTGLQRSYVMLPLNMIRNILTWYDRWKKKKKIPPIFFFLVLNVFFLLFIYLM